MAHGGEFQAAKINAAVESKLPSLPFCSVQAADVSTEQRRDQGCKGSGRSSVGIELLPSAERPAFAEDSMFGPGNRKRQDENNIGWVFFF